MKRDFKSGMNKAGICGMIFAVAFVVLVVVLVFILMTPKKTYTSSDDKTESISVLYCKALNPVEPFFASKGANPVLHEIKVTFNGEYADKYNYTYSGKFPSTQEADKALSQLHADYNNYMGKTNVYQEDLSPTFSLLDSSVVINLFIEKKYFIPATAKFVFIDNDEYVNFLEIDANELKKVYEAKGFSCEFNK